MSSRGVKLGELVLMRAICSEVACKPGKRVPQKGNGPGDKQQQRSDTRAESRQEPGY